MRNELIKRYQHVKFNDEGLKLEGENLVEFLFNCDRAIIGLEKLDSSLFSRLPKLKTISRFGVGLDGINLNDMEKHGIKLGWTPGVNKLSVAELTLSFMLALLRNSFSAAYMLKNGAWEKIQGYQLTGKTIGIIGVNHIGKEVIRLLKPFDCRILINDILDQSQYCEKENVQQVNFESIIQQSDIVSLHIPLTTKTQKIINQTVFNQMKKTAFLINTSRGGIVDETALKKALINNQIAGAALDVYNEEPPRDKAFLTLPNLICTPHIAGNAYEAEIAMGQAAIMGLENAVSVKTMNLIHA